MHYHIEIGMPGRLALDMEEFARRLATRWPGATVLPDPVPTGAIVGGVWFFDWPEMPLVPVRDRAVPDGIRWLLKRVSRRAADGSWQGVPLAELGLGATSAHASVMPALGTISFFDSSPLDCAICAVWLRRWLPSGVPISIGAEDMSNAVRVEVGMVLGDLLWLLLGVGEPDSEISPGVFLRYEHRAELDEDPATDGVVAELVRRVEGLPESTLVPEGGRAGEG